VPQVVERGEEARVEQEGFQKDTGDLFLQGMLIVVVQVIDALRFVL